MDNAWEGFCRYLEKLCQLQACDRAFNNLVSARLPLHVAGRKMYERAKELGIQIMRNAQEQGVLRGDVTAQDIAFVIWSQAGIIQATRARRPPSLAPPSPPDARRLPHRGRPRTARTPSDQPAGRPDPRHSGAYAEEDCREQS